MQNKKRRNNKKKKNNKTKENGTRENKYERLRALIGDDTIEEVLTEDNAYSMKKAKKKIEMKINMHHADHIPMKELDGLIKLEIEREEKKQIKNEHNIVNKNEQMTKRLFELTDERDKYRDLWSKALSEDYEDIYDEVNNFTEDDSMSDVDDCPSDFGEWITWNQKRTRSKHKGKYKSYSD